MITNTSVYMHSLKRARKYWDSPDFRIVTFAALLLITVGTLIYSFSQHWSIIDGLYFSVATLTTTNVSDPNLVITSPGIKLFTVGYIVIGIGVLLRFIQLVGQGYVAAHAARTRYKKANNRR